MCNIYLQTKILLIYLFMQAPSTKHSSRGCIRPFASQFPKNNKDKTKKFNILNLFLRLTWILWDCYVNEIAFFRLCVIMGCSRRRKCVCVWVSVSAWVCMRVRVSMCVWVWVCEYECACSCACVCKCACVCVFGELVLKLNCIFFRFLAWVKFKIVRWD